MRIDLNCWTRAAAIDAVAVPGIATERIFACFPETAFPCGCRRRLADRFRRIAAVADRGSNWRFRPQADEIGAPKRPFENSVAAVRDGSALTPFRWCSGFSLWESGRHKV